MNVKNAIGVTWRIAVASLVYCLGTVLGGIVASSLGLPPPTLPDGVSQEGAAAAMFLASPLPVIALAVLSGKIAGGWVARTLQLSFFTLVAYTLNTALDAILYLSGYDRSLLFSVVSAVFPSLLCGGTIAALFKPVHPVPGFRKTVSTFFNRYGVSRWIPRLFVAALCFMPVYLFFGLLVEPFTGRYYIEQMHGLKAAGWGEILPVQALRSALFLAACFPLIASWLASARNLFLSLGAAFFILVGLTMVCVGYWLPLSVRIPHALEILADSFTYSLLLMLLLVRNPFTAEKRKDAAAV